MQQFLKDHYDQLKANFKTQVLDHVGNEPHMQDAGAVDLAFQTFAQDEERNNKHAYEEQPNIDLSSIQERMDQELMDKNLRVPEEFVPPRGPVPEDRPELEWDYKPVFGEADEMEGLRIVSGTPEQKRDGSYIQKRINNPWERYHFDKITRKIPGFRHDDLGRVLTEEDKILMGYYERLWPRPDGFDAIGPAQKLPGLINKIRY